MLFSCDTNDQIYGECQKSDEYSILHQGIVEWKEKTVTWERQVWGNSDICLQSEA